MSRLGLKGPWELTGESVDEIITSISPGNYALGYANEKDKFIVRYVGRSDGDLNDRLHKWTGKPRYPEFKADYATSPEAAFEKECHNYHDFGEVAKLDNKSHPDRPNGSGWECPVCDIFG